MPYAQLPRITQCISCTVYHTVYFLHRKPLMRKRDQMGPKEVTNLKLRRKNRVEISKFINLHVQKVVIFFLTAARKSLKALWTRGCFLQDLFKR